MKVTNFKITVKTDLFYLLRSLFFKFFRYSSIRVEMFLFLFGSVIFLVFLLCNVNIFIIHEVLYIWNKISMYTEIINPNQIFVLFSLCSAYRTISFVFACIELSVFIHYWAEENKKNGRNYKNHKFNLIPLTFNYESKNQ